MDKLNLNLLPIAFALYDERSVSRAARALGMSQPAVSMALRKLRAQFNDPLFIRSPNGVTPTPRAHALIKSSRPLVTRLQEDLLSEKTFDAAHAARAFTFARRELHFRLVYSGIPRSATTAHSSGQTRKKPTPTLSAARPLVAMCRVPLAS